jgi:hypothetical protein
MHFVGYRMCSVGLSPSIIERGSRRWRPAQRTIRASPGVAEPHT